MPSRRPKRAKTASGKLISARAVAKSVRKPLPPAGKAFKVRKPARSAWRKELER